jgi:hypothetical protein
MRVFTYDNRGFLLSEQHPELGTSGNGIILHDQYDARGHSHRSVIGPANGVFDLTFELDSSERITRVAQTAGNADLKLFVYDDVNGSANGYCATGRCRGKLAAAARYNYPPDLGGIWVTEGYQYDGKGGRLSRRDIAVGSTSVFTGGSFATSRTYTSTGDVDTVEYPCRTSNAACLAGERLLSLHHAYSNGFLRTVTGWASDISYQPSGMIASVTHGLGAAGCAGDAARDLVRRSAGEAVPLPLHGRR